MSVTAPPLAPLTAKTRQITFDTLSPPKRNFFKFAFPGFFDSPFGTVPKVRRDLDFSTGAGVEQAISHSWVQFQGCRRYAGDFLALYGSRPTDLPRRSYHALTGPDGTDGGLLRNELLAYANFEATGGFMLIDALLEGERAALNYPERNALLLILCGKTIPRAFQSFAGCFKAPKKSKGRPLMTALEARFAEFSADRVLDLRKPDARAWFYDAFSDFGRLSGPLDPMLAEALSHERPPGPVFEYMLPALCSQPRGGGWQSQVIGIVLRRLGVEAFVFPSARCDPEVRFENGEMTYWRGWNVVDYRGAPPPLDIEASGVFVGALPLAGPEGLKARYRGRDIKAIDAPNVKHAMYLADPFWTDIARAEIEIAVQTEPSRAGSFSIGGLDDAINSAWSQAWHKNLASQN